MASKSITKEKKVTSSKPTTVQEKKTANPTSTKKTTSTESKKVRPNLVSSSIQITKKEHVPEKPNPRRSVDKSPSPSLGSPSPITRGRLRSPSPSPKDRLRSPSPLTRGRLLSPLPSPKDRLRSPSPSIRNAKISKIPSLSKSKDFVKSPPVPKPQKPKSPGMRQTKKPTKVAPRSKSSQRQLRDQNSMILEQDFERIQHGDDSDFTHETESEDGGNTTHSERSPMGLEDDHDFTQSRDESEVGSQCKESFEEQETDNLQYHLELESEPESDKKEMKNKLEPEVKHDPEPISEPIPKIEDKSETTMEQESERKPILEPEPESEPKVELEPEPETEAKPEVESQPEPEPEPKLEPEPVPEVEHKSEPESSPKTKMEHMSEPNLEPESAPNPNVEDNLEKKDKKYMDTENVEENKKGEGGGKETKGGDTTANIVVVKSTEKKDATDYNNVIEKTVSKLQKKRVPKVSALVGAFETIISLESEQPPGKGIFKAFNTLKFNGMPHKKEK